MVRIVCLDWPWVLVTAFSLSRLSANANGSGIWHLFDGLMTLFTSGHEGRILANLTAEGGLPVGIANGLVAGALGHLTRGEVAYFL